MEITLELDFCDACLLWNTCESKASELEELGASNTAAELRELAARLRKLADERDAA